MTKWWREEAESNIFDSLSVRTKAALLNAGIDTIEKLRASNRQALLLLPGFGTVGLRQVTELLCSLDDVNP